MNERLIPAIYARVSSQKQADEQTIGSQFEGLVRQVESDGLTLLEEHCFSDDGYSGAELQRSGLETLRDRVAAGLIDRVYIHSPDRLAQEDAPSGVALGRVRPARLPGRVSQSARPAGHGRDEPAHANARRDRRVRTGSDYSAPGVVGGMRRRWAA